MAVQLDDYFALDGTGDYLSIPDTNLLDADTAHLEQSTGLWTVGALSTEQATFGTKSLKVTGGASTAITVTDDAAAMGVFIYSPAGDTFDINSGTGVAVPAATWTEVTADSGNAGTYTVNAAGAGDYYIGKAYVQDSGSFVPSLRIVGDLDIECKIALPDWSVRNAFVGKSESGNSAFRSYEFHNQSGGDRLQFVGHDDSSASVTVISSSVFSIGDNESAVVRVTAAPDAGGGHAEITFYVDGVQLGNVQTAACSGAWQVVDTPLTVGAFRSGGSELPLTGSVYYVTVRDGIVGPIVASISPGDVV